jgi:hypothetical protein
MDLAREDDHWGERPSRGINAFNNYNPFAIPWLYSLYAACSMTGCSNNLSCMCHTHLEASFIKIVDILFSNTIFYYSILNKIKPLINNLIVLTFCTLIIVLAGVFRYNLIMSFNKTRNPVEANSFSLLSVR